MSSQPTLSRFENADTGRELNRLWREYERDYMDELDPAADLIVLDVDSTDDPTHGDQQLSFFHGFYDHHMFHPLLVFDALSGQLITALLRPGRAHAAKGAISILTRLIRAIRRRCPRAQILVRGDSAFAMPKLLDRLEQLNGELGDVDYVIGVAKNSRLLDLAESLRSSVAEQFDDRRQFVRRFTSLAYASKSWPAQRAVVCKVEHSSRGENPRFVVTTLSEFSPGLIYDVAYCPRGQSEKLHQGLQERVARRTPVVSSLRSERVPPVAARHRVPSDARASCDRRSGRPRRRRGLHGPGPVRNVSTRPPPSGSGDPEDATTPERCETSYVTAATPAWPGGCCSAWRAASQAWGRSSVTRSAGQPAAILSMASTR